MAYNGKVLDVIRLPIKVKKKKRKYARKKAEPLTKKQKVKKARDKFWQELPPEKLNPNAEQDFDSVLGEMLKPTHKPVKHHKKSHRKPPKK